ncbi:MAG: YihY/virulence factor BrkB family protein [Acidobacteria bacterium]|nr:YihY/virulence factor BrkB family protein [Acidobacteriota bacterium]
MSSTLVRLGRFLAELVRAQHRDRLALHAGALAYTSLLSVVPILTVLLVTAARLEPSRADLLVRSIASVLPFSSEQVQQTLADFAQRTAALGWIAVTLSFLATINAFFQIEEVINTVWGVPQRRPWRWRIASIAAIMAWGPLLLITLFSFLYWLSSRPWYTSVSWLGRPLPALFAMAALTAFYRGVPHTHVPWKAAFVGGVVAGLALLAIHVGFQAYLGVSTDIGLIYGSLTALLLFLISLFLLWLAVLLGVEASWVVGHRPPPLPQAHADAVVTLIVNAHLEGSVTPAQAEALLGEAHLPALAHLTASPAFLAKSGGGYQLTRPAGEITAGEVLARVGLGAGGGSTPQEDQSIAALARARIAERSAAMSARPTPEPPPH